MLTKYYYQLNDVLKYIIKTIVNSRLNFFFLKLGKDLLRMLKYELDLTIKVILDYISYVYKTVRVVLLTL